MQRSLGGVSNAMANLVGGLSLAGLVAFTKGSIDAVAALDDLSEKTSLSVETLSQLQEVTRIGGHSLDEVGAAAGKFAKSVSTAAGGNEELLKTFRQVGISADDLKNKSFDELFVKYATNIAGATDKTNAIALAMKLTGKSAAELMPFFNDLAERGLSAASVFTETSAAADKFQKNLNELSARTAAARDGIIGNLLPGLLRISEEFKRSVQEGESLLVTLARVAGATVYGDKRLRVEKELSELAGRTLQRTEELAAVERGRNLAGPGTDKVKARLLAEQKANDDRIAQLQQELKLMDERDKPKPKPPGITVGAVTGASGPTGLRGPSAESEEKRRLAELKRVQQETERGMRDQIDVTRRIQSADLQAQQDYTDQIQRIRDQAAKDREKDVEKQLADAKRIQDMDLAAMADYGQQIDKIKKETSKTDDFAKGLGLTFSSAFEDAVVGGKKFRDVLAGIASDIAKMVLRKQVTEPLANAAGSFNWGKLFGGLLGGGGSVPNSDYSTTTALFGGMYPSYDVGTDYVPRTGLAMVHQGEAIIPAGENRRNGGVNVTQHINVDSRSDMASIQHAMAVSRSQAAAVVEDRRRRTA